ncbi:hypothetical protein PFLUV_G00164940 [Perca fluviatilis]|uniref:Uncharacterized protein n=1 Tax=Perca fluviatilis TaxID=8168 RepID=A0A6A5F0T3_PERFL|nr:stabilizer of axonemal microtubules 2 isoform X1 [Perca fluviatilis]KAF1380542.1 hypothetical protein PFLUV_G00164940 [Perca fluviatilis]
MHTKIISQQNGNQGATSVRKPSGSQTAQPGAAMTTEYQERFLCPHGHNPNHPPKGTSDDMTTIRSYYVTQKWIKHPPKAPQPSLPPKDKRCGSATQNHVHLVANQLASKLEDYTTVYQKDFQAWKANKRKPFKLADSLRANEGLGATDNASKEGHSHEPQPFESVTSYRFDYVKHPVQPRTRTEKPVCQTKGLPCQAAVPLKPKVARDMKQELSDEAREFFQQFKTWSLENKFHGQGKAKKSSPPADHDNFLSTTHADYTAHKCQRTKPFLPSKQTMEKSKEPFQATTTMKEDYKTWNTPRRFPIVRKAAMDWPSSLCPKVNETAVCHSNCDATTQVSGLEHISNGNEESRMYWTTSLDKGVTWADSGICEDPPNQTLGCMVLSRS